jgi:hypothetical protein
MRAESDPIARSPQNGHVPHGLPTSRDEPPASGFTAVNSDHHRQTSFRPDVSARPSISESVDNKPSAASASPHSVAREAESRNHGWRPDERERRDHDSPNSKSGSVSMTGKRKREDPTGREHGEHDSALPTSEHESPKRRATASISNSPSVREPKPVPEDGPTANDMPPSKRRYVLNALYCLICRSTELTFWRSWRPRFNFA